MSATAYLCLGANLGDARANLDRAVEDLAKAGITIVKRSSVYRTPPWGPVPQPPYLNQVVEVESPVDAPTLLALALATERRLGRDRSRETRFGPRPIDIDILAFGDLALSTPDLQLPHPRLLDRAFALVPLTEIAPDIRIGTTRAADALARLDRSGIEPV